MNDYCTFIKLKRIVFGDVKGQYGVLCKRLSSIITKTGSCEVEFH